MGKHPVLKPREVVAILEKLGFTEARQRGSHKQIRHPDGRSTTVPFHGGRDISRILLRQIAKDIGLTVDVAIQVALSNNTFAWSGTNLSLLQKLKSARLMRALGGCE